MAHGRTWETEVPVGSTILAASNPSSSNCDNCGVAMNCSEAALGLHE
ncbi:hypothetical protein [Nannocystis radixulma]|nr:hypothetical protein [Nannocystis radixulma]